VLIRKAAKLSAASRICRFLYNFRRCKEFEKSEYRREDIYKGMERYHSVNEGLGSSGWMERMKRSKDSHMSFLK
jgi:hypothetical protein